jgi:uncharacterized membrane protein
MSKLTSTLWCLFLAACSSGSLDTQTGSTCPRTDMPTYADFARPFMTTYCTGCHSRAAPNRHGAPRDENFDTEADLHAHATEIDLLAAKGPDATNTDMPDMSGPVRVAPSDAERARLGEYLACTARE